MLTWYEAVTDTLLTVGANVANDRSLRHAKMAVREAVSHLATARKWNSMVRSVRVLTSAKYDTGTITYDHTGGTHERELTLAGGTWPTWSTYGHIIISDVPYEVDERISDTVITLTEDSNPAADVAALTTYELYRESITLPKDFGQLLYHDRVNDWNPEFVSAELFRQRRESQDYTGQPRTFSLFADRQRPDRRALYMHPAPSDGGEEIDLTYYSRPVPLTVFDYSTGTVTTSGGARAVTGSGTTFTSGMAGCVIRYGDTSSKPDALETNDTQFVQENVIDAFDTATSLRLQWDADQTSTAVMYRISSLIDVIQGPMRDALLACARWRLMVLTMQSANQTGQAWTDYQSQLSAAARDDQSHVGTRNRSGLTAEVGYQAALSYPQVSY